MHDIIIDDVKFTFRDKGDFHRKASHTQHRDINKYLLELGDVCSQRCIVNDKSHKITHIGIAIQLGKFLPFMVQLENGEVYSSYDVNVKYNGVIIPLRSYIRAVGKGYIK